VTWLGRESVQRRAIANVSTATPPPAGNRSSRFWLLAFTLGIVLTYGLLWIGFLGRVGPKDFDQFLVFHELQYWNAALFGLAKQWSPVMCGGLSLAGEPQVPFMSLSMMISYGLGPLAGMEVATAAYLLAGWAGTYLYAGLWWPERVPRALAASLFIGNGFFACRLGYGHMDFVPFLGLPLLLWSLHRSRDWLREARDGAGIARLLLALLLLAGGISVAIDGSPVAIIHLLFWAGLYAAVLSISLRSLVPLAYFGVALLAATALDAGYLWPMLRAQEQFQRLTPDSFTNPLSLPWFMLLPVTGKLIVPATGKGHELSVFIGPVLAWLIWRYRHPLSASLPATMKWPLGVVAASSVWLGMGSLVPLHVPAWLSPFDLLRPLPGFRSLMVTGRFWGFLALPLSLLAAGALWHYLRSSPPPRWRNLWLGLALLLQVGFPTMLVLNHWLPGNLYEPVEFRPAFRDGSDQVNYVPLQGGYQGRLIRPTQGVINCYDNDDFVHADVAAGSKLVTSAVMVPPSALPNPVATARFRSWSRIQVQLKRGEALAAPPASASPAYVQLLLNQAWHPYWHSSGCSVLRGEQGNLVLNCPLAILAKGSVLVEFRDRLSARGAEVSRTAWVWWLLAVAGITAYMGFRAGVAPRGKT
jgi:hypothetical protein